MREEKGEGRRVRGVKEREGGGGSEGKCVGSVEVVG